MAFLPRYGLLATEPCDVSSDFAYPEGINVDGAVRQVPDVFWSEPEPYFRAADWDYETEFFPSSIVVASTLHWDHYPAVDPYVFPSWSPYFTTLREYQWETNFPSEWFAVSSLSWGLGDPPETYIEETGTFAGVNNTTGWTIDLRFMLPKPPGIKANFGGDQSDYAYRIWENQVGIHFDDGTYSGKIYLGAFHTLFSPDTGETFVQALSGAGKHLYSPRVPYGYVVRPRQLRLTVQGNSVVLTANSGISGQFDTGTVQPYPNQKEDYSAPQDYTSTYVWTMKAIANVDLTAKDATNGVVYLGSAQQNPYDSPYAENPEWLQVENMAGETNYTLRLPVAGLSASSGNKFIRIGRIGGELRDYGYLLLDRMKFRLNPVEDTGEFVVNWPTGTLTTVTSTYQPTAPVSAWTKAVYKASRFGGGTLGITPQYDNGGGWTSLAETVLTAAETEQDLTSISPAGDLADKIRFSIRQVSTDASSEAPRLEEIRIVLAHGDKTLDLVPSWGPADGGNEILVTLDDTGVLSPASTVYVDGALLDTGRVAYVDTKNLRVTMPAHDPGDVSLQVVSSSYFSKRPYTYVATFDIEGDQSFPVSDMENAFASQPSPFRVVHNVPDGAVNIALMGAKEVTVPSHFSLTDLSDLEPNNRAGQSIDIRALQTSDTGSAWTYSDRVDTDEILVTDRAATWRSARSAPLFYKYLVGRGRYSVKIPAATGEADLGPIRNAVRLIHSDDRPITMAWDIQASSEDRYGEALPTSVYSIVLYTEDVPGETLWVEYMGLDMTDGHMVESIRREVVNPVPAFSRTGSRMKFATLVNNDGSYDVEVTP